MRRLITHLNPLLLGVILGMIFLAIVQASPSHGREEVRASSIVFAYEIPGANHQKTILLIPGTAMHCVDGSAKSCGYHAAPIFRASFSTIAMSVSLVRLTVDQHPCAFRK
jgi:hypothetical protein